MTSVELAKFGPRQANIPRAQAVVIGRIPGPSSDPFVTGWASVTEESSTGVPDRSGMFLPSCNRPCQLILARRSLRFRFADSDATPDRPTIS
jgi:hypothetical protein